MSKQNLFELNNKVAIITGGMRGIRLYYSNKFS